jgi:hypothetical protein
MPAEGLFQQRKPCLVSKCKYKEGYTDMVYKLPKALV